jgi:glycosyltransferase involved in cell wall biosynthesis
MKPILQEQPARRRRILTLSIFPAPYRVEVFNELGKETDLRVLFERNTDFNRPSQWFKDEFNSFTGAILTDRNPKTQRRIREIEKRLFTRKFDVVLLYDYTTIKSLEYMLLCRLLGIPYFLNCDGAFINTSRLKAIVKRLFISGAAGYFASGKKAREYFEYFGARREKISLHPFTSLYARDVAEVVPSTEEKARLRQEMGLLGKKIGITASRFIPSKKIEILIKAWAEMPVDHQLIVVGSGDLEDEYKTMVKQLGLDNVLFPGYMERAELLRTLRLCDVYITPTEMDTWGLVVNEAMACGLPVIATDKCIAGLELIREHENGRIVPVGDVGALRQAITEILSDEQNLKWMSMNALETIRPYTYENIARAHLTAIEHYFTNRQTRGALQ